MDRGNYKGCTGHINCPCACINNYLGFELPKKYWFWTYDLTLRERSNWERDSCIELKGYVFRECELKDGVSTQNMMTNPRLFSAIGIKKFCRKIEIYLKHLKKP